LKQKNPLSDNLTQSQPWTTIEDKDSLANATMARASLAFQDWVETTGKHENRSDSVWGRSSHFFYVNDESIESVINPIRASEKSGNFLVLVDARKHLDSCSWEESDYRQEDYREHDFQDVLAEIPDTSWKLYAADEFKGICRMFLRHYDPWNNGMCIEVFQSAPYVHSAWDYTSGAMDHNILYPDKVGYDVYKMLKQFYGPDHLRSVCFDTDEAQTGLQRMCGYAGGYRKEQFTYPWYL
jgi:hypothetical protein